MKSGIMNGMSLIYLQISVPEISVPLQSASDVQGSIGPLKLLKQARTIPRIQMQPVHLSVFLILYPTALEDLLMPTTQLTCSTPRRVSYCRLPISPTRNGCDRQSQASF